MGLTPEALNDLADRLARRADEVVRVHGSVEPPEDDMRPADRLWFAAQDAADALRALAPLEAENQTLRGIIDRYRLVFKMLYEVHALVNFDTPEDSELQAKVLAEALDCLTPAEAEFFASRESTHNQEPQT